MYTVINNKVYNTETARKVAEHRHGSVVETLYRKKTGEYFAHFYDSEASDNDRRAGWKGKDKIAPYDYVTAYAWAEMSLDKEEFARLFLDTEDTETEVFSVRISKACAAKLRRAQAETGIQLGQLVEQAVNFFEENFATINGTKEKR